MKFNYALILIAVSTLSVTSVMAGMNGYILPQRKHVAKQATKKILKETPAETSNEEAKEYLQSPDIADGELDNIGYVQKTRDSYLQMLVKASKMYRSGKITKENFIEVSMKCAQMEEYYANIVLNKDKPRKTADTKNETGTVTVVSMTDIPGAMPVNKTASGNSTILTCNAGYMTYQAVNGTVCVPTPNTQTTNTATPGNHSVEPRNGRDCDAGYVLSSANGPTVCEPLITEITAGVYRCAFTDQVPEADSNGLMKCVNKYVSDNGSTKTCGTGDAAATQGCVVGYFYNKKMQRYYPTIAAGEAAWDASQNREPATAAPPVMTGREMEISHLYSTLLGRSAEPAGLKFWNDSGENLDSIKTYIMSSDEYKNKK